MAKVFHVIPYENWQKIQKDKQEKYTPESLSTDGFIHFCKADQLRDVITNFFSSSLNITIFRIDENALEQQMVYEPPLEAPNSGVLYPHYYGSISTEIIEKVFHLQRSSNSNIFKIPNNILR